MPPLTSYSRGRAYLPPVLVLLLATSTAGCGSDSTGTDGAPNPSSKPGITIVAGANVTDTIGASPARALHVVVRDAAGHVLPGAVVRFSSVPLVRPGGAAVPSVLVGDLSAVGASTFLAETTSAEGTAFARVVFGQAAGIGGVTIAVPQAGLVDTVRYTITPGAATKVVLPIVDTTIQVGRAVPLAGRVEDRSGNAQTDAITYQVTGAELTVADGQVRATAPARAAVIGRLDRGSLASDTTWVSAVPAATIAARRGAKLVTSTLDGTGLTEIPHTLEASEYGPEWHPNGQSLLAVLGSFSNAFSLHRVELGGAIERLVTPGASNVGGASVPGAILGFAYSPDGQWVHLSGNNCNYNAILYRFPLANPAALQRLSPAVTSSRGDCFDLVNHWPSLSPDGTQIAFENQTSNQSGYSVRVLTIATQAVTQLVAGGQRPRWSPAGDLIAYWTDRQIWVVRPDGTGARVVSPPGRTYLAGVRWSPDGQWLLARFEPTQGWAGTTVALLNVGTRLEIPLRWTTAYNGVGLPAWKPVP